MNSAYLWVKRVLLEAVKEIKKELSGVTPPKGSILLKGESVLN